MSKHRNNIEVIVLGLSAALVLLGCPADPEEMPENGNDAGGDIHADAGASDPDPDPDPGPAPGPDPDPEPGDEPGEEPGDEPNPDPDPDPGGDEPGTGGAAHVFMPTDGPANTRAPKLLLDAAGDLHAVYPAYAGGDAYYSFCPDGCSDPDALEVVHFTTEGTVLNAMLALTRDGAPRVLLQTGLALVYAQCDDGCTAAENWQSGVILEHGGDREVTGNALALDSEGRPRFVMHTYIALLGIGQKPPQTFYAQCDGACTEPSSWRIDVIQEQIWEQSQLQFDDQGRAHLATVAVTVESGGPTAYSAAYAICEQGCTTAADWTGILLLPAYESYSEQINPAIAMALTPEGGPRIAQLAKSETGGKNLVYFECDTACHEDNWRGAVISERDEIGSGVDIELGAAGQPRIAFTLDDNIGIYHCEEQDCIAQEAVWDLGKVEFASELPEDNIILWPNCTIDAWVLHDPSLVLAENGDAFVGYQATDLSGGFTTTDPTKPACLAGADMTLTRLAVVPVSAQ